MEPLVSVIIPVYNVAPYLQEAIDSVISQTYYNLEILIIDDGSNDGSETICDAYQQKDPRIKVIHQENRGLGGARNTGLDLAQGELIAFLDSDDAYEPDAIRVMAEKIQTSRADICVCGYKYFRSQKRRKRKAATKEFCLKTEKLITSREALIALAENIINPAVWNKVYRREVLEGIRFTEGVFYEDICITYKLLEKVKAVQLIRDLLIQYRIRSDSITHMGTQKHIQDYIRANDQYESYIRNNVPEIYNDRQLQLVQEQQLRGLIALWTAQVRTDRITANILHKEIIKRIKSLRAEDLSFTKRIKYRMIRYCPGFFLLAFSVYCSIRK